jgi:hypothetical protein
LENWNNRIKVLSDQTKHEGVGNKKRKRTPTGGSTKPDLPPLEAVGKEEVGGRRRRRVLTADLDGRLELEEVVLSEEDFAGDGAELVDLHL